MKKTLSQENTKQTQSKNTGIDVWQYAAFSDSGANASCPTDPLKGICVCEHTFVNHFAVAGTSFEENACSANAKVHTIIQSKHTHTSTYKCMQYIRPHSRYVSTGSVRGLQRPPPEQTPGGHLLWEQSRENTIRKKTSWKKKHAKATKCDTSAKLGHPQKGGL